MHGGTVGAAGDLHGLHAVHEWVEHHLHEPSLVTFHTRCGGEIQFDGDPLAPLRGTHTQGGLHDVPHVERRELPGVRAGIRAQIFHDLAYALHAFERVIDHAQRVGLLHVSRTFTQILECEAQILQRIVDLMANTRREPPQRGEALLLDHLPTGVITLIGAAPHFVGQMIGEQVELIRVVAEAPEDLQRDRHDDAHVPDITEKDEIHHAGSHEQFLDGGE